MLKLTKSPKQNRVTPFGEIIATPAKGMFMGNRGILHNEQQEVVTPFMSKAWIICLLQFRGRKRAVMSPGAYTELFFLDEATALAAGHRPCFECQRARSRAFRDCWLEANSYAGEERPLRMKDIDVTLHQERLTPGWLKKNRRKQTYTAVLNDLPPGTFLTIDGRPFLFWQQQLYPWTPAGYEAPISAPASKSVTVLTPPSTVQVLHQGYVPIIHPSLR